MSAQATPSSLRQPRRISTLSTSADTKGDQGNGRALLVDWPRRVSAYDEDKMDVSVLSSSEKVVSFSSYSRLHVYQTDDEFERNKSYSSKERKKFQAQALGDAFHIQGLIEACPYEGGQAIRYLMDKKMLYPEELLGIENMIMGAEKIIKERRKHSILVIKTQKELLERNDANIDAKLAYVATSRSIKTFEKARLRAALAA